MVYDRRETAILVAVRLPGTDRRRFEESLEELRDLALTAGAAVADVVVQERDRVNPKTFIGSGKATEIKALAEQARADLVIFNHELSPSQQRNLEDLIDRMILDRTALILDIFAQRARSKEGSIQVELAQDTYRLPRLRGRGVELSRLGGGIGTKGPGETKLEVDRRRITKRIRVLKQELEHIARVRKTQAKRRKKACVFAVSMVGYTNAGKSTLLNLLTDAGVLVEDKLFATLDSTTRQLVLPGNKPIVISDTVGFIQDLPHQLVAAFRSTLEGVREANLLMHVIDVSYGHFRDHIRAVDEVLREIGAESKEQLVVFNKTDLADELELEVPRRDFPEAVFISARTGDGISEMLEVMSERVGRGMVRVELFVPVEERALLEKLYGCSEIVQEHETPQGVGLILDMPRAILAEVEAFRRR